MPKYLYAENVTKEEFIEIQSFKRQRTAEFVRGRIIELSAMGKHPKEISKSLGLSTGIVREWIRRFNKERISGLVAKKSTGRPRKFPETVRYQVRAIISDAPDEYDIPKSRWTLADICRISVDLGSLQYKEQIRRLFVDIGWTYTRAKKWQRSPDPLSFRRLTEEQKSKEEEQTKTFGEVGIRK